MRRRRNPKARSRSCCCFAMSKVRRLDGLPGPCSPRSSSPTSRPVRRPWRYLSPSADGGMADRMYHWIPFWPDTAAVNAIVVNKLYIAELGVAGVIVLTVLVMMLTFCIRYRRGSTASRADLVQTTWHWEVGWTAGTLGA